MARNDGIRVDRDMSGLISRFTVDPQYVVNLFFAHIQEAAEEATEAMERRVRTARTDTGVFRAMHGGAEGRIETGKLIQSLRSASGSPVTVDFNKTSASRIAFTFGYQQPVENNRGEDYREHQEYGEYSLSGRLLAQQIGYNVFIGTVFKQMSEAAKELSEELSGKLAKRSELAFETPARYVGKR